MEGIFQGVITLSKLIWLVKGYRTIANAVKTVIDNITSGLEKKNRSFIAFSGTF